MNDHEHTCTNKNKRTERNKKMNTHLAIRVSNFKLKKPFRGSCFNYYPHQHQHQHQHELLFKTIKMRNIFFILLFHIILNIMYLRYVLLFFGIFKVFQCFSYKLVERKLTVQHKQMKLSLKLNKNKKKKENNFIRVIQYVSTCYI